MSDGKEVKFLFVDDLSQPPSKNNKVADFEKLKEQWYEHCEGKSALTVLGGTVISKFKLYKEKEQGND